ncbi:hypothetical protein SAMN05446037_1005167 [Anaerovirgula multivorans]|uniref:Uncharacterized protein n=1 Tax=Anaerovirgula multivorans TaxID=312168 RepID=A0A239CE42_9FIRM|nr:hypothetical protein [Anaerovirgula multivorans]SNS18526.1 hypothetical protein SAMN05446037_1005167 [Anaerovirgula multivorans]
MNSELYRIKKIANDLGKNSQLTSELKLLQELIESTETYKRYLMDICNTQKPQNSVAKAKSLDIKIEKISEEVFLCKPVMVKNYYEGDYLERFSEIRTSDLKTCGALEIHNKFWTAHEVFGGNIFASIPLELINDTHASKLQRLNWDKVQVDIYEIESGIESKASRGEIINTVEGMFNHYILVREVYGNVFMILHYKI